MNPMNEELAQHAALVFAIAGAAVMLAAMIGFLRLPDVYCRSHALGVGMTLGFSLLVLGLWCELGTGSGGLKLLAAIVFQFATIPVASHLLVLQARRHEKRGRRQQREKRPQHHRRRR